MSLFRYQGWIAIASLIFGLFALINCGLADSSAYAGGFLQKIDDSDDRESYVLFVPHGRDPSEEPPVILFLNGLGENGDDGLRHVSRNFGPQIWPMRGHFPFLGVAYQCSKGGNWGAGGPDAKRALAILDEAIAEYGGDPDRVILTGCSAGGFGVWSMASAEPGRFAAIVPLCGAGGAEAKTLAGAGMPVWNFYNEGDAEGLVAYNRSLRGELLAAGASPLVTEYRRGGHRCWDRAYVTPALYAWMLEQNRTARTTNHPFRSLPAEAVLKEWIPQGLASWTVDEGGEIIAANSADDGLGFLASAVEFGDVEVHLDVRFDPRFDCRVGLISDGERPAGYVLTLADVRRGEAGLSRLDGQRLASLDPAGQSGLLAGDWNDVRIERKGGRLTVRVNGWKSLDAADDAFGGRKLRLALFAPEGGSETLFRYLRFRSPEANVREPATAP